MTGIVKLENGQEMNVVYNCGILTIVEDVGVSRASLGNKYYYVDDVGDIQENYEEKNNDDTNFHYMIGNYYTNKLLLQMDLKADILMKQIKRYARQYNDYTKQQYFISYNFETGLYITDNETVNNLAFYNFMFDKETANSIINKFKEDLLWYFEDYLLNYSGVNGHSVTNKLIII